MQEQHTHTHNHCILQRIYTIGQQKKKRRNQPHATTSDCLWHERYLTNVQQEANVKCEFALKISLGKGKREWCKGNNINNKVCMTKTDQMDPVLITN